MISFFIKICRRLIRPEERVGYGGGGEVLLFLASSQQQQNKLKLLLILDQLKDISFHSTQL